MTVLKTLLTVFALGLALPAMAHPHISEDDQESEPRTVDQIIEDMTRKSRESGALLAEKGKDVARDAEDAFVDSELMENMSELLNSLAERVEIDRNNGTALLLDGDELLRLKLDRHRSIDDILTISGLGRNLSVERETVTKNGKTKTRIIIEMDGGEDVDIDLPVAPDSSDQE